MKMLINKFHDHVLRPECRMKT